MTNDIEYNYETSSMYRGIYNTCETVGHDCSKSLDTPTEGYDSSTKECFNYIMRSPKWSGGGDSTDNLSLNYLSGCDGISTNDAPKEIRMTQPCKSLEEIGGAEPGTLPTGLQPGDTAVETLAPRCFDEEKLLIKEKIC